MPVAALIPILLLAFPFMAVAADNSFVPLAPIPGLTQNVSATQTGIAGFLSQFYIYLIGVAVMLAVIMIIWGGLLPAESWSNNTSAVTPPK
jgi:hypothetical protein